MVTQEEGFGTRGLPGTSSNNLPATTDSSGLDVLVRSFTDVEASFRELAKREGTPLTKQDVADAISQALATVDKKQTVHDQATKKETQSRELRERKDRETFQASLEKQYRQIDQTIEGSIGWASKFANNPLGALQDFFVKGIVEPLAHMGAKNSAEKEQEKIREQTSQNFNNINDHVEKASDDIGDKVEETGEKQVDVTTSGFTDVTDAVNNLADSFDDSLSRFGVAFFQTLETVIGTGTGSISTEGMTAIDSTPIGLPAPSLDENTIVLSEDMYAIANDDQDGDVIDASDMVDSPAENIADIETTADDILDLMESMDEYDSKKKDDDKEKDTSVPFDDAWKQLLLAAVLSMGSYLIELGAKYIKPILDAIQRFFDSFNVWKNKTPDQDEKNGAAAADSKISNYEDLGIDIGGVGGTGDRAKVNSIVASVDEGSYGSRVPGGVSGYELPGSAGAGARTLQARPEIAFDFLQDLADRTEKLNGTGRTRDVKGEFLSIADDPELTDAFAEKIYQEWRDARDAGRSTRTDAQNRQVDDEIKEVDARRGLWNMGDGVSLGGDAISYYGVQLREDMGGSTKAEKESYLRGLNGTFDREYAPAMAELENGGASTSRARVDISMAKNIQRSNERRDAASNVQVNTTNNTPVNKAIPSQ